MITRRMWTLWVTRLCQRVCVYMRSIFDVYRYTLYCPCNGVITAIIVFLIVCCLCAVRVRAPLHWETAKRALWRAESFPHTETIVLYRRARASATNGGGGGCCGDERATHKQLDVRAHVEHTYVHKCVHMKFACARARVTSLPRVG